MPRLIEMNGFGKQKNVILSHQVASCFLFHAHLFYLFSISANSEGEETVQDFLKKFNEKATAESVDNDNVLVEDTKSDEKIITDESSDDIDSIDDSIQSIDSQL